MKYIDYNLIGQDKLDDFFEKAFKASGFLYEPDTVHKDLRNIKEVFESSGGGFWGLLHNDLIIGTVGLKVNDSSEKIGELKCMYLLPEYQGKGLGQLLIKKILIESKNRQFKKIRLDVKIQSNKAISIYRKNGFYEIPKYNDNKNDVLFMEKILEVI